MWFAVHRKMGLLGRDIYGSRRHSTSGPRERFDEIHKLCRKIMTATSSNPNVVDACTSDNRLQTLSSLLSERLDSCQKSESSLVCFNPF
mmetsp:Transcript_14366/g.21489  ORF Transcript_14366/g.21489 Transcript_14366/m.21489 type:complete len:89 (-) Transcript_14366:429-695(-)